jgi:hypothetical protein
MTLHPESSTQTSPSAWQLAWQQLIPLARRRNKRIITEIEMGIEVWPFHQWQEMGRCPIQQAAI